MNRKVGKMLVSLKEQMDIAQKGSFAVPAFNVYNIETMMGAMQAAEKACAPVILQVYARLFRNGEAQWLAAAILAAAGKAEVPVCFHLDHGLSDMEIERALKWGATGVMFDGSLLPLEENILRTQEVVEKSRRNGVAVEGELGHVGSVNDESMGELTNVRDAVKFAEETKVAALAVLAGNAHGHYKKTPHLDIDRLKEIYEGTNHVPLVLHGGSGIPDDQIRSAVKAGIRKVNFGTDVCCSFLNSVKAEIGNLEKNVALDLVMKKPVEAVEKFCLAKIRLLGAEGMAEKK